MPKYDSASKLWDDIPGLLVDGLSYPPARRDLCALECLANDREFAKPDSQKVFVMWEAKTEANTFQGEGISIQLAKDARLEHSWVVNLFLGKPGIVRFPFNTWDTDPGSSLSWQTIIPDFVAVGCEKNLLDLPRWSTASRSCFVLIPENASVLNKMTLQECLSGNERTKNDPCPPLNLNEWNDREINRLFSLVHNYGLAVGSAGVEIESDPNSSRKISKSKYRLYSLKTGVKWVGNKDEETSGKNILEHNSALAQVRSDVIQSYGNRDLTFGIQTEVLTITAPTQIEVEDKACRDGFQVRDLSCLRRNLDYLPCQAIPYARDSFDSCGTGDPGGQCLFWREAFAIPLGRAKARLLLNFGLVHMSANAQNFLLGFLGSKVQQFVARDLGDTSWHDLYIDKYFKKPVMNGINSRSNSFCLDVFDHLAEEKRHMDDAATLYVPEAGAYPAPRIMRLTAGKALTHGFAEVLKDKQKWQQPQLYKFATGILDGFRDFIQEALLDGTKLYPDLPDNPPDPNEDIQAKAARLKVKYESFKPLGEFGGYPPRKGFYKQYKHQVDQALEKDPPGLFKEAALVRQFGNSLEAEYYEGGKILKGDVLDILVCAEELLLCAGLEKRLGTAPGLDRDTVIVEKILRLLGTKEWPPIIRNV